MLRCSLNLLTYYFQMQKSLSILIESYKGRALVLTDMVYVQQGCEFLPALNLGFLLTVIGSLVPRNSMGTEWITSKYIRNGFLLSATCPMMSTNWVGLNVPRRPT